MFKKCFKNEKKILEELVEFTRSIMTAHQDKLPGPFDFQETAEKKWSTFTRHFKMYLIANELTTKPENVK